MNMIKLFITEIVYYVINFVDLIASLNEWEDFDL